MDKELDRFKTEINLTEFAASRGYVMDPRESWASGKVFRHSGGDKIIISMNENGHWVYYSVRDNRDQGTIIDFVQRRDGGTLGHVRKTLRAWDGSPRPPAEAFCPSVTPRTAQNRDAVRAEWDKAAFQPSIPYLIGRGIGPDVLALPRFMERCRIEPKHKNVLFPHIDREGLCGFEVKNKGFTGFSSGGVKGLWFSHCFPSDKTLVIAESAIDAISHYILHPSKNARYLSTGGSMNPQQPELISSSFEKMPEGSEIVLAFDNDAGGEKLMEEVAPLAPATVTVRKDAPEGAKDWNQVLKNKMGLSP
jgi:hypothetical protein